MGRGSVNGPGAVIRILLVDDHAIERQGVRALLDAQPDMTVVGEAPDGLEALPVVGSTSPDVIVTETIIPRMNGLELTGQVLRRYPQLKVLALTRNDCEDCVLRLVQAGATGYLLKTVTSDELVAAVRAVVGGSQVLRPSPSRRCCTTTCSAYTTPLRADPPAGSRLASARSLSSSPRATPIRTSPRCSVSAARP